jgi:hypothetical protein
MRFDTGDGVLSALRGPDLALLDFTAVLDCPLALLAVPRPVDALGDDFFFRASDMAVPQQFLPASA